eukprot:TRINITY_DN4404_c0_g1_i1.p1 TRINITY_DN4404_c0_g1~~TRINITY_DN4404_c0_g1_i1.p1  ORF type:complete len:941 (+),score=367.60 TRINITY_DN4404_c0_g1_i1:100-2922(+)
MGDEESVKVAVRMRLFNGRERSADAKRIVRMTQEDQGSKTFITNPDTQEERHFQFDYSFQSHSADEPGIGEYATQDTVFNLLGKPVLYTALEGRNVCLFAYGQTGAGKSFSMLGKSEPKELQGIIPRSCMEIFRLRDQERDDPLIAYNVSIQVVEIYCEMINDLLADRKTWPANGHKARLTKDGYVVDTVTRPCFNYEDIESAFTFADKNRSVGSHALNPESSRAHTIYTINYERKKKTSADAKMAETISAKINLVDLAGSERSESAGTSGQMLKEGNAINLSLTALGSTIKALSEGKRPNFRDSKLTLLLQGSMTNGKVIMIAAVSPASICYDESMSTLRFAERIKMVKIKAKKNVTTDPVAEIKKEMEEMRKKMQEEIDQLRVLAGDDVGAASEDVEAKLQAALDEQKRAQEELKADFEKRMKEMNLTDDDRRKQAAGISSGWNKALGGASMEKAVNVKEPHLRNLNEDARLAETLVYKFKEGTTRIGRADKDAPPDIEFNGMGIIKKHCSVDWDPGANQVFITPASGSATVVNGKRISDRTQLVHNNRLWLGNNYAFRFVFPGQEDAGDKFETPPDYLYAEAEIAENAGAQTKGADGVPSALGHQLSEALKKVEQANIIATDLNKEISFQPKIIKNRITGEDMVVVRVDLPQGELTWPWEKFNQRLVDMVRLWQSWQQAQDQDQVWQEPEGESPFSDDEDQLIGESDVWLQSLGNMIEHEAEVAVLAPTGATQGHIQIEVNPLDKGGGEGPWDGAKEDLDPFVDNVSELLNKEIQYIVKIKKVVFAGEDVVVDGKCRYANCWVRYRVSQIGEEWASTDPVKGQALELPLNFAKKHKRFVDADFVQQLEKGRMIFQIWGKLASTNPQRVVGRNQEVLNEIHEKQQELCKVLKSAGVKNVPAGTGLPEHWSVVLAYKAPDGSLHTTPPAADAADEEVAA